MAQADFSFLLNVAPVNIIARGVTFGATPPNGGEDFVFGFNSLSNTEGAVGLHLNAVGFNPTASGGSIRGAIQRGTSGGDGGFSTFLFIGLSGTDVADTGYFLGLDDDEPSNLILRKGLLSDGIPPNAPGDPATLGTLRRSVESYTQSTWVHVRLDMIVNGTGDVILRCYQSNLDDNPITAPVWEEISGMDLFVDDALGINTGSVPLVLGRMGFGFHSTASARRGFVDGIQGFAQTPA